MSIRFELPPARTTGPITASLGDITEQWPCTYPVVYGFVRLSTIRPTRRTALEAALRTFCTEHELTLGGLFVERRGALDSPAFAGLLAALALPNTYGVVLPSAAHLGCGEMATVRRNHFKRIGVRLLLMRGDHKRTRRLNDSREVPSCLK